MREKGCPAEKGENEQCKIPRTVRCPHLAAKEGGVAESGFCHLRGKISLLPIKREDAQLHILG